MKYIIEIKPEYEDSFKGVMILGAKEDNLFVDTIAVENLEELNSDYINAHFSDLQDTAYQRGLEDGKAQSERGCEGCRFEGTRCTACENCCNSHMNHWTAKDDKIVVGDEVYCKGDDESDSGVVTWAGKDNSCVMWQDGSAGEIQKNELIKTGRHFDIDKILEEMRND